MNNTQRLHDLGQSIWLDNISRRILDDGTLRRYIDEFSVTGLTSNPTIFDEAIGAGDTYDDGIRAKAAAGSQAKRCSLSWRWKISRRAADLFKPIFDATIVSMDGFRWSYRRCWPTTPHAASKQRPRFTSKRAVPICSSRFPARPRASRRSSGTRSSPVYRSTSRCCFRASNIWRQPRLTCAASSGGWPQDSMRGSARWRQYSSAAGIGQSATRCRHRCATGSASQ